MKMSPHPALACGQGQLRRRCSRGGDCRDAGAGARRRRESEGRLRSAAGGHRSGQGEDRPANSRGRAEEHDLRMASRRRQSDRRSLCRRQARYQARYHQQSPGPECDGAARCAGRIRCRHRRSHARGTRRRIPMWRVSSSRLLSAWPPSTNCASSHPMWVAASARKFSFMRRRSSVSGQRVRSGGR